MNGISVSFFRVVSLKVQTGSPQRFKMIKGSSDTKAN